MESFINVTEFNALIFKDLDLDKLLENKNLIKKINIKNQLKFESSKLPHDFIEELNLKVDLAYGSLSYSKSFQ